MKKVSMIFLALFMAFSPLANAHSGRTDSNGGHNCSDKSKAKGLCSGYHYHNGDTSSGSGSSGSSSTTPSSKKTTTTTKKTTTSSNKDNEASKVKKSYSESGLTVYIEDEKVQLDPKPILFNSANFLPLRVTAELLGAEVAWDQGTKTITISKDERIFMLTVDSTTAKIDGKSTTISSAPITVNNVVYVSIRVIAEGLGYTAKYQSDTDSLYINK